MQQTSLAGLRSKVEMPEPQQPQQPAPQEPPKTGDAKSENK